MKWSTDLRETVLTHVGQELNNLVQCHNYNMSAVYVDALRKTDEIMNDLLSALMRGYVSALQCVALALAQSQLDRFYVTRLCELFITTLRAYHTHMLYLLHIICEYLSQFESVARVHGWELVRTISACGSSRTTFEAVIRSKQSTPPLLPMHVYEREIRETVIDPICLSMFSALGDIQWLEDYMFTPTTESANDRVTKLDVAVVQKQHFPHIYQRNNRWWWHTPTTVS